MFSFPSSFGFCIRTTHLQIVSQGNKSILQQWSPHSVLTYSKISVKRASFKGSSEMQVARCKDQGESYSTTPKLQHHYQGTARLQYRTIIMDSNIREHLKEFMQENYFRDGKRKAHKRQWNSSAQWDSEQVAAEFAKSWCSCMEISQ